MSSATRGTLVCVLTLALLATSGVAASAPPPDPQREASAAQAPDLERWRLTRHGFGRLTVGLTRAQIEARAGRSLKFAYNTGPCAIWSIRGARGLSVMTTRGRLARVHVGIGPWRTKRGIGLGDSEAKVRRRYGRIRTQPHAYDPGGQYLILKGARRRIVFETDGNNLVTGIRGGRVPQVMYIEGCA